MQSLNEFIEYRKKDLAAQSVGLELKEWRAWYDRLLTREEYLQKKLGKLAGENPELESSLKSISSLLNGMTVYPFSEDEQKNHLK